MKVPLLTKSPKRIIGQPLLKGLVGLFILMLFGADFSPLFAEGSKDFVNYDGYRMFLDTRDPQQLKVYANAGETINVGSSHVGIDNGFIQVYDPAGNLFVTFDGTGTMPNMAIINNSIEELAGPTGGGTTMGDGYMPGTITVPAGQEGVWTVVFDYPSYEFAGYDNILNNAPWTRADDQPNNRRVVLAWDITVTTGGAGNEGGTVTEGRVYTNEHISLIDGNGFNTSPIFYVLTEDGYLYQVNINEADPFRFPISSNSLGLVDGNLNPIYKSKPEAEFERSDNPSTWMSNNLYLYEPQAEDQGALINNKIFFNIPSADLPLMAPVTDIYRSNSHDTWLLDDIEILTLDSTYLAGYSNSGLPCAIGTIEFEKGGYFYFETNLGGSITLQLDLDNNGSFDDPIDTTLMGVLGEGLDSLFWSGYNGLGLPVPVQNGFNFNYQGSIRYGELHIALTDVEGSNGGVTFDWLNAPAGFPTDQFYYDHSDIFSTPNAVSGGGAPGDAQSTNIPYTYPLSEGNDNYIDQWFFIEFLIESTASEVNIVVECVCANDPDLAIGGTEVCEDENLTLTASNSTVGVGDLTYTWTGPNFTFEETVGETETSTAVVTTNATSLNAGSYTVVATNGNACTVTEVFDVIVNLAPVLNSNQTTVTVCENGDVQFCATNSTAGIGDMTCTWTGPNGFFTQSTIGGDEDICLGITNVDLGVEGVYTLVCSFDGCESQPLDFTLDVQLTPEINGISPTGGFCVGDDVTLTAQNVTSGTGPINYEWFFDGSSISGVLTGPEPGPFDYTLTNIQANQAGEYTLVLSTSAGCESVPQSTTISIAPSPQICNVTGGGDACVGQDVTLSGFNCASDVLPVTWTWTGPSGIVSTNISSDDGPYEAVLTDVQVGDSGTYCLNVSSNGNGCEATEFCVDLNVLTGLNVIDITPDSTYCVGSNVVLTGTATSSDTIIYTWTDPAGDILCMDTIVAPGEPLTCIISDISIDEGGTYTLTATSFAGCTFGPYDVEVNLFPYAEITSVTGGGDICDYQDVELNGTGMGTASSVDFTWTSPSGDIVGMGTMVGVAGPFPGFDDTPEDGNYVLTVTTPDGCTDTEVVNVNLGCTPIAEILFGDTTLCELDTLTLCGQNLNTDCDILDYTWVTPTGIPITGSAMGTDVFCDEVFPLVTYGTGTYYLYINSGGCISLADSVEVTLNPNPIISELSGGGTFCEGDTAIICFEQLNPEIDSFFYTCNLPGGIQVTSSGATGDVICIEITEPGFIFCSIESFEGCVSSLNGTEVIFDSGFDLDVTGTTPICSNEILELNGSNSQPCTGDANYEWIDPSGTIVFQGTAPCEGPFPASINDPISGDYCLVVSADGTSCSDTACVNIEVLAAPEVTVGIDGGGDFCTGDETILTATVEKDGGGDIDFVWTLDGTMVASGTASSGDEISLDLGVLDLDASGEYCLELTCPVNGCVNIPTSCTTVTVSQTPDITDIEGAGTYCEGVDVELNASGTPGPGTVTYIWEGPNFEFTGTADCGGPYPATISNIQQNQAGAYTLTVIKGECQTSETITINVNPTPIVTISSEPLICDGEETTLTITIDPNGANSVDWELDGPNLMESGTVTELTTLTFTITAMDGDVYTLTATSDQGCEADVVTEEIDAIVIPMPVLTASPNPLCPGDDLVLTTGAQSGTDVSYCWIFNGDVIATTADPTFTVVGAEPGDYQVQAKVDGCDETSDPVAVVNAPAPDAVDDSYEGTADMDIEGSVLDNDTPNTGVSATVTVEPENGSVSMNNDGTFTYTPDAGFAGEDSFTYQICLDDCPDLCDEAVVTLTVNPTECIVPNIITPNGDGTNDILFINCVPVNPNNSLRIFNRWGDEIYSAEPYNNDWDGTKEGEIVPVSTYFYLFRPDRDSDEVLSGYIRVSR